jgi:hypothetical protein
MDLNDLYYRHGVSLLLAEHASCERSQAAHRVLAESYAVQIAAASTEHREFAA